MEVHVVLGSEFSRTLITAGWPAKPAGDPASRTLPDSPIARNDLINNTGI